MTTFTELGLSAPILKALADEGYETPTPIQASAIPHIAAGRDLLGIAQTGTGKTAAFALPILHRLAERKRRPERRTARALILSPTRELASQIAQSFSVYGRHLGLTSTVVFGGVGAGPQIRALARGVDILVATPGRLLDHLDAGRMTLDGVEILVLDEADQMLDMGFIQPLRRIVKRLPAERQSLFFSATMPKEIDSLAADLLDDPARVSVTPVATTVERVTQRIVHVDHSQKRHALIDVVRGEEVGRGLVFTRTKRGADRVAEHLAASGIAASAIHGNKSQSQREKALAAFRAGRTPILVATDIAARGIDIDGVTHVINFELPNVPESYVHRIGRTGRAGASGIAISFCDGAERPLLRDIEKLIRQQIPAVDRAGRTVAAEPARAGRPAAKPGRGPRKATGAEGEGRGEAPPRRRRRRRSRGPVQGEQRASA